MTNFLNPTNLMHDATELRRFILSGKAILTLQSGVTQAHYTYRIRKATPNPKFPPTHFVDLHDSMGGMHVGMIRHHREFTGFVRAGKAAEGFAHLWEWLLRNAIPPQAFVYHAGVCGRCGRELTNPESIRLGLGPECAGKE